MKCKKKQKDYQIEQIIIISAGLRPFYVGYTFKKNDNVILM